MIAVFSGLLAASLQDVTGRILPLAFLLLISAAGAALWPKLKAFFAVAGTVAVVWAILCPMMFAGVWTLPDSVIHLLFVVVIAPCYLLAGNKVAASHGAKACLALSGLGATSAWLVLESGSAIFAAALAALAGVAALMAVASGIQSTWGKRTAMTKQGSTLGALLLFFGALVYAGQIYGSLDAVTASALALAPLALFGLLRVGGMRLATAASAVAALGLYVSACNPLSPSGGREKTEGGVQVALSAQDMKLLAGENPTKVRIRVYAVIDGAKSDQEGNDAVFDLLQNQATYKVSKVKLGMKEFEVTILNDRIEAVGSGSARHLVKPGLQQMDPISIQLVPPEIRRRSVAMDLFVQVEVPGEGAKTTYLDVKGIIQNCVGACHTDRAPDGNPTEPKGGLILKNFPFTSVLHPDWTQDDIVADMVYWMKDMTDPMPPPAAGSRVPNEKIDLVEKWRTDGLLKFPSADQTADLAKKIKLTWKLKDSPEGGEMEVERSADPEHPFRLTCPDWVMGGSFELKFEILAIDGTLTQSVMVPTYVLPRAEDGEGAARFEQVLTIPYEEPVVDIPVIVTR